MIIHVKHVVLFSSFVLILILGCNNINHNKTSDDKSKREMPVENKSGNSIMKNKNDYIDTTIYKSEVRNKLLGGDFKDALLLLQRANTSLSNELTDEEMSGNRILEIYLLITGVPTFFGKDAATF